MVKRTCIIFNEYKSNYQQTTLIDQDHIIDYLLNSNNQSILFIGRTNIDLYSTWVEILRDLTFNIQSPVMVNYSFPVPNRLLVNSSFRITLLMHIYFLVK